MAVKNEFIVHDKNNPNKWARAAGFCYLAIIVCGILSQLLIHKPLASLNDASAMAATLNSSWEWRLGLLSDIVMQIFDIPVMIILYFLLKPVNGVIALVGLTFNVIQTSVLVANKLALLIPMIIFRNPAYQAMLGDDQTIAFVRLLLDINSYGFSLGLIFFGLACLAYGYLIFNSDYLPRLIGMLVSIAGISYLIYSFSVILLPATANHLSPILLFCLLGELSLCLWLMAKGVNKEKWVQNQRTNINHIAF